MEAARDFIPFEDEAQGMGRDTGRARQSGVDGGLALLQAVSATALDRNLKQSAAAAAPAVGRAGVVLKKSDPSGGL